MPDCLHECGEPGSEELQADSCPKTKLVELWNWWIISKQQKKPLLQRNREVGKGFRGTISLQRPAFGGDVVVTPIL